MSRFLRAGLPWFALFVCLLLAAMVYIAPAALLAVAIESSGAGGVRLDRAKGTLWSGNGTLEVGRDGGTAFRRDVQWTLDPDAWGSGILVWRVALADGNFRLSVGPRGWTVPESNLRLPVAMIAATVPSPVAGMTHWRGQFFVSTDRFGRTWDGSEWQGSVVMELRDVGIGELSALPFGSYRLTLTAERERLRAGVNTLAGLLRLSGAAVVAGTSVRCEVRATSTEVELMQILDHIGDRVGNGEWRLVCPSGSDGVSRP